MSESSGLSRGIECFAILTMFFVVFKLCGVIAWPWIWVLAGIWGPIAIEAIIVTVLGALNAMR